MFAPRSRQARRLVAALLIACAAACAATPAEYRQRVGVYVWGAMAGGLAAAAEDVKKLGADQAVRVFIGPAKSWDPADKSDNSPLDVKVSRPDYRAFLAGFRVVMLTAYDAASFERYKFVALDAEHLAATTDEFRRFTLELAKTPGRKIISNWEFENDCPADRWPACTAYYQARLDGVVKGRAEAKALGYPGEILTAFEFTIVPGFAGRPSGLVEVSTKLKGLDYISYSSWWSLRWDASEAKVREDFDYLTKMLRDFVIEKKLGTKLILGEFGEYWDLNPSGARMRAVVDASLAGGVEYLFDWVLYEQPGKKDNWNRDASHFGKYDLDRKLTPQGESFRRWFATPVKRGPPKRRHAERSHA